MVATLSSRKKLSELQTDALKEVANIGTGHAVTALAEMTGQPFNMSVPAVGLRALETFAGAIGDAESISAAVYMPVDGDAPGHAAFLFPFACACGLADLLLGQVAGTTVTLGEMECSALTEVGNILVGSFLNALSELTALSFPVAPPGIAVDMSAAILASLAAASPCLGDHALTIMTHLQDSAMPVEGIFLYIPEPAALSVLFQSLGVDE